jgi:hypothetical protein
MRRELNSAKFRGIHTPRPEELVFQKVKSQSQIRTELRPEKILDLELSTKYPNMVCPLDLIKWNDP